MKTGSVELTDFVFALIPNTSSTYSVFGIGFTGNEATLGSSIPKNDNIEYDNFPVLLKKQNQIERTAYSLYLYDAFQSDGALLFGGVDHAQYTGGLWTVPLVDEEAKPTQDVIEFSVKLDRLILTNGKRNDCEVNTVALDEPLPVLLIPAQRLPLYR